MRTPHLATAVIALAASMGGGYAAEIQAPKAPDDGPIDKPFAKAKSRWRPNQRQRRKDQRRAFAAGCLSAFH